MAAPRGVPVGVGGAVFLVAGAFGFAIVGEEFSSVFYVLPIALAAAVAAGSGLALSSHGDRIDPSRASSPG